MYESTYTSETLKNFFNCLDITILRAISEEKGSTPGKQIVMVPIILESENFNMCAHP